MTSRTTGTIARRSCSPAVCVSSVSAAAPPTTAVGLAACTAVRRSSTTATAACESDEASVATSSRTRPSTTTGGASDAGAPLGAPVYGATDDTPSTPSAAVGDRRGVGLVDDHDRGLHRAGREVLDEHLLAGDGVHVRAGRRPTWLVPDALNVGRNAAPTHRASAVTIQTESRAATDEPRECAPTGPAVGRVRLGRRVDVRVLDAWVTGACGRGARGQNRKRERRPPMSRIGRQQGQRPEQRRRDADRRDRAERPVRTRGPTAAGRARRR